MFRTTPLLGAEEHVEAVAQNNVIVAMPNGEDEQAAATLDVFFLHVWPELFRQIADGAMHRPFLVSVSGVTHPDWR